MAEEIRKLTDEFKERIEKELGEHKSSVKPSVTSREYKQFKKEILPNHLSIYEKLCNFSEKVFKVAP
ncbi:MAG: hypothetical protein ACTSWQ_02885, partial [Candidatus Thorarchaeota archaeon]